MNISSNNYITNYTDSARHVIAGINSSTTPEQFDELCKQYPDYHLEDGAMNIRGFVITEGTALSFACCNGSPELVEHIAKKNINLLNQQDKSGHTALWVSLIFNLSASEHQKNPEVAIRKIKKRKDFT